MWLGIETGILTDGSKYFDNLVGQIEKPDSLSASAAEKKRAADGILEISIWKREIERERERERGKEAKKAGGRPWPLLRISSTRKWITDYELRRSAREIHPGSMRGIVSPLPNSASSFT